MVKPEAPEFLNALLILLLGFLAGCGTLPSGKIWGRDATLTPGWDRVKNAAGRSATSPHVWIPAGAALLVRAGGADERLSDWAVKRNPVFGSTGNAEDASDTLMYSSFVLVGATALATPSGELPGEWLQAKLKGVGVEASALLLTGGTTELLKNITNRTRPDGSDQKSFPSGHTSVSAANSMLAYRNAEILQLPEWSRTAIKSGCVALPYATGWARIEANKHYPSDVFFGAALGNFLGAFVNAAFLGVDSADGSGFAFDFPQGDSFTVGLNLRF